MQSGVSPTLAFECLGMGKANAITLILYVIAGVSLLTAAGEWLRLVARRKNDRKRRKVTFDEFRATVRMTALAFALVALALLWSTLLAIYVLAKQHAI